MMAPMRLRRNATVAVAALALGLPVAAVGPAFAGPALSASDSALRAGVRAQFAAVPGTLAVRVADVQSGQFLAGTNVDRPMVPASTMKLVTAVTSVLTLGADHRFTTLVRRGDTAQEVVIVGGGDPLLTSADLGLLARRTAGALQRVGISQVRVELDDTLYPAPTNAPGWLSADVPTYAAPVRALGLVYDYSWDTAANAAATFATKLRGYGISASYAGRDTAPAGAPVLARVRATVLAEAVDVMLTASENNVAEQLFRQVALSRGMPATWAGGAAAARGVLTSLGIPQTGVILRDGSGLSSDNRLTPRSLVALLRVAAAGDQPRLAPMVSEPWLPVSGVNGTLTRRFTGASSCAVGDVFAKTGSLTGVQTLAGLTRGADGRWKAFAIMVNNAYGDARTVIDRMAAEVNGCV